MTIEWQLPPGAGLGPLRFPVPDKLLVAGIVNYVYERDHALLTRLKVPADASGTLPIRAEAQWLACTDKVCVPERGELLARPAGRERRGDRARPIRRMAPRAAAPAGQPGEFAVKRRPDRDRHSAARRAWRIGEPYFFPADDGPIDYAAPQSFRRKGDLLIAELKRRRGEPAALSGVLALGDGRGLEINAMPGRGARAAAAASVVWARRPCFTRSSARLSAACCST